MWWFAIYMSASSHLIVPLNYVEHESVLTLEVRTLLGNDLFSGRSEYWWFYPIELQVKFEFMTCSHLS